MAKSQLQRLAMEKAQAYRTPDTERRTQASRDLAEAKIADAVKRALATAPPLTNQQIHRLTALLRTSGGAK